MESTSYHGRLEAQISRVERSINPLKTTTRSLSNRQHALESSVATLAWSVQSLAGALQQHRDHQAPWKISPPKQDGETPDSITERMAYLERAVRRCEAVQDRLVDVVGTALKGYLEVGLTSLETRLLRQQAASEQRTQALMRERLDKIEAALRELKQPHDGISFPNSFPDAFPGSFSNSFTDTTKLEDVLQFL
jgi:hypothetical protein